MIRNSFYLIKTFPKTTQVLPCDLFHPIERLAESLTIFHYHVLISNLIFTIPRSFELCDLSQNVQTNAASNCKDPNLRFAISLESFSNIFGYSTRNFRLDLLIMFMEQLTKALYSHFCEFIINFHPLCYLSWNCKFKTVEENYQPHLLRKITRGNMTKIAR